ncbi:MAG: hypothetical protein M1820_000842 [Bogoriella megaspora]|nr:MAG: hypothetical protein M1820_000842 [Bogoriella megaspora]
MQDDQKNLEQRNQELIDALKDKTRSHQQVQKLYQTLKAQVMATQAASAASDDAENAINTVATNRFADHSAKATFPNRVLPFGAEPLGMAESRRRAGSGGSGSNGHERGNQHFGNRLFSGHGIGETPSSHRTRLPRPLASNLNRPEAGLGAGQGPFGLGGRIRQPLAETDGNSFPISVGSGYGMSAGMKMGRHSNFPINRPTSRVTGSGMPSNVNIR